MGRRRSVNTDLPKYVRRRRLAGGGERFYFDHPSGRREALGGDYWKALERARKIVGEPSSATIVNELEIYALEYLPTVKASTAKGYRSAIGRLAKVFGQVTYSQIKRADLVKYVKLSTRKIRAKNDIATLSSFWSWALNEGRTEVPNPRIGIEFKALRRKGLRPPTQEEFDAVYEKADRILRDVLDLLHLTGQDVRVVLGWRREHLQPGWLDTTRSKTEHPIRIELVGEFAQVVQRCLEGPVKSLYIVSDDRGQRLTYMRVWNRHKKACEAASVHFELRAIRRKTGSDADSLEHAQELLGHADTATTRRHYRKGELVRPLK